MNGFHRQGYGRRSKKAVCDLILDLAIGLTVVSAQDEVQLFAPASLQSLL
jgi:hypothetical protein